MSLLFGSDRCGNQWRWYFMVRRNSSRRDGLGTKGICGSRCGDGKL